MKFRKYLICLVSPPYPDNGYYLEAIPYHQKENFESVRESLSPDIVDYTEIVANNVSRAKALGLKILFKRQK